MSDQATEHAFQNNIIKQMLANDGSWISLKNTIVNSRFSVASVLTI